MADYLLNIRVLNCEDLLYHNSPACKCNPFVRFQIYGTDSYYKSETINEESNPVWNEEIEIPVSDIKNSQLSIELLSQEPAEDVFLADPFLIDLDQLPVNTRSVAELGLPLSLDDEPVGLLNLEANIKSVAKRRKTKPSGPINIQIDILEVAIMTQQQEGEDSEDPFLTFHIKGKNHDETVKAILNETSESTFSMVSKDPLNDVLIINLYSGKDHLIKDLTQKLCEMAPGTAFVQDLSFSSNKSSKDDKQGGHLKFQIAATACKK